MPQVYSQLRLHKKPTLRVYVAVLDTLPKLETPTVCTPPSTGYTLQPFDLV